MDSLNLSKKIVHRNWKIVLAELYAFLCMANPGEVISLLGPSRVGKTKLIRVLMEMIASDHNGGDTGLQPVLYVEAANTGSHGAFSTKAFTQRMLEAVNHPILSMDENYGRSSADTKIDRTTESSLRRSLERAIRARQVKYIIIDEAQHVKYTSKNAQAAYAVMDSWKCLAQSTGVVLIIVGAYPIIGIVQNSPHMIGRKHQIHFPRYKSDENDLSEFASILKVYTEDLDMEMSFESLLGRIEQFYDGTLGCIGLLNAWLRRAHAFSKAHNSNITWELIDKSMPSRLDLGEIEKEISYGEKALGDVWKPATPRIKRERKVSKGQKPFQRNPKRMSKGNRS